MPSSAREIRRESQSFDPGTFFSGTYSQYAQIAPVAGSFHTHEAFTELTVPVLGPDMKIPLIPRTDAARCGALYRQFVERFVLVLHLWRQCIAFEGLTFRRQLHPLVPRTIGDRGVRAGCDGLRSRQRSLRLPVHNGGSSPATPREKLCGSRRPNWVQLGYRQRHGTRPRRRQHPS